METAPRPAQTRGRHVLQTLRERWRWLTLLGLVLLVAGVTFAQYTDEGQVGGNFDTTGGFNVTFNGDEANPMVYALPFDITHLDPGDVATATLRIANTGTMDAHVYLDTTEATGGADLLAALRGSVLANQLVVDTGALTELGTITQDWLIPAGGHLDVDLKVELPASAGNEVLNQTVSVIYTFRAEQEDPSPSTTPIGVVDSTVVNARTLSDPWQQFGSRASAEATYGMTFTDTEMPLSLAMDPLGYGVTPLATLPAGAERWHVELNGSEAALGLTLRSPDWGVYTWEPATAGTYEFTYDLVQMTPDFGGEAQRVPITMTIHITE